MAMDASAFLGPAKAAGFDLFTGVPCSFLTPLMNGVLGDPGLRYVAAASEGEAVAIAAGAWLGGRGAVVMMQNSGLGNAVNPLTSLNDPFRIPVLLIVSWRGGPGLTDEPQHALMGRITPDLLDVMGIPHAPFPTTAEAVPAALDAAVKAMADERPFAFIVEKGALNDAPLDAHPVSARPRGAVQDLCRGGERMARFDALKTVKARQEWGQVMIATTGKCGRELFTLGDSPNQLYQVGSMGCAGPMGLGLALTTERPVLVIDGDGAVLMKMGALATIAAEAPPHLTHLVLDNGTYDSTGGQPTAAPGVDFAAAAVACGYAAGITCDDTQGLAYALAKALETEGPVLIHMRIAPGSRGDLGRPTVTPDGVARRFRDHVAGRS
ncbi:MAG: phosphonopyruvate decarboxylase [Rhodobacterales bacterium]|nr:phosphonopyruvate decarboxylase [Rhodobacterales bacterium]